MTASEALMAAIALLNLVMVVVAWRRTVHRDTGENAATDEQMRTDVRYMMRGIDDIRADVRMLRNDINDVNQRVSALTESVKSAHKRIDEHLQDHHYKEE